MADEIEADSSSAPKPCNWPITRQTCWRTQYLGEICSTNPSIQDTANCIRSLAEINLDQQNEIKDLDTLLDAYKSKGPFH